MLAALRILVGTAWREARKDFIRSFLETAASLGKAAFPWWIALVAAGVENRRMWWVLVALSGMLGSVLADWILRAIGATAHVSMAEKVSFAFERKISQAVAALPTLDHFDDPRYADDLQVIKQNQGRIGGGMSGLLHAADVFVNAGAVVIIAATVEPRLLVLALAAVPALPAMRLRGKWLQEGEDASAGPGRLVDHYRSIAIDPDLGMELRVFGLRRTVADRVRGQAKAWQRPRVAAAGKNAVLGFGEEALSLAVVGITLWWLLEALAVGGTTPAVLVAAIASARQIQQSMLALAGEVGGIIDTLHFVQRAVNLAGYGDQAGAVDSIEGSPSGAIILNEVSFQHLGAGRPALRKLSVEIPSGHVVAVVGENGAGKSTLVELLLGLRKPTSGTISGLPARSAVTAAFQDFTRPELTIAEAIGLGDPPAAEDLARVKAAASAGGAEFAAALPSSWRTRLGPSWPDGVDLSGGQWQRVALARGSMREHPELAVLDEPTAALDAHAEDEMFARYARSARLNKARGAVTLLVTHRYSTVRHADIIIVLDHGEMVESGSHAELMRREGHYFQLYTLQQRGYLEDGDAAGAAE